MTLALTEDALPEFLLLIATAGGQEVARVHLTKDDFDGPMSVKTHPTIVTSLRIAAGLLSPAEGNWSAAATFLDGIEDAGAFATGLGYNLEELLA